MYEVVNTNSYLYEIKGSKFYSFIYNVKDVNEIENILNKLKNEYQKATHYTYAYRIGNITKKSDDGEPSGTAGSPILNIIEKNKLNNTLIVVIRYFGGIKLGAGGLIRAYSKSANNLISKDNLRKIIKKETITINTNYKNLDKILSIINKDDIINKEFGDTITLTLNVNEDEKEKIKAVNTR